MRVIHREFLPTVSTEIRDDRVTVATPRNQAG
jgi:hypothetical protein